MSLFPETPEMESQSCLETVPIRVAGLWDFIAPRLDLRSGRGLNQSCSPQRELSNTVLHSRSARRKQVDSRLLVVGSQTASLTPGSSFAHNLGCRCLNDQCEAIFDIYVSRPFQWHQGGVLRPKTPRESKVKTVEEQGVGARSLACNTSGVEGRAGAPG
jgi:hypothetical protein